MERGMERTAAIASGIPKSSVPCDTRRTASRARFVIFPDGARDANFRNFVAARRTAVVYGKYLVKVVLG